MLELSLLELNALFDRVCIWYPKDELGATTGETVVVLHKDAQRHIGVSRTRDGDQFDRKKGRAMAANRALHAADVSARIKEPRAAHVRNRLSFTHEVAAGETFDEAYVFPEASGYALVIPSWMIESKRGPSEQV